MVSQMELAVEEMALQMHSVAVEISEVVLSLVHQTCAPNHQARMNSLISLVKEERLETNSANKQMLVSLIYNCIKVLTLRKLRCVRGH